MARRTQGEILEVVGKDRRTYRTLRFQAQGKRRRVPLGPISREQAETKLTHTMADVERGTWKPPEAIVAPTVCPTFAAYVDQWWTLTRDELSANTQADYRWRLEVHLLDYFGAMTLDQITAGVVKAYTASKLARNRRITDAEQAGKPLMQDYTDKNGQQRTRRARPLSARSINMTVTLLGAILASAIDDDDLGALISRNAARGRRVKENAPRRSYLDSAAQITALLDAAGELDAKAPKDRRHVARRAMLAVLTFAGLRVSEMLALRWADVDLAGGWLTVGDAKTDAGRRRLKVRGALRDELSAWRGANTDASQDAYVFATRSGAPLGADNFRNRVLRAAVKRADEHFASAGLAPLPDKLTPHSLRRTFCSLLYALGETPPVVMQEMGHTDPALALRVYAQAMRRGEDETQALRALVEGAAEVMPRRNRPQAMPARP
jgi:integrase